MEDLQYNKVTLIDSKKTNVMFVYSGILFNTIPSTIEFVYAQLLPLDKFLQTAWPSSGLTLVSSVLSNPSC
jgi:ABC-type sulfate transport system permease subunit